MQRVDPRPAVVIVSGDFLAHRFGVLVSAAGDSDVTAAAQRAMTRIARSLGGAFPSAQFLIVLGNNDDPCGDYRTAPRSRYLAAVARIWGPLVNRHNTAPNFMRTFSRGGYYLATIPGAHLRVAALDDVFWSVLYQPCGKVLGDPARSELEWLGRALATTPASERDAVVMHIPPGVDASTTLLAQRFVVIPFLNLTDERRLVKLVSEERAHIAFAIAGHTHRSDFRLVGGVPMLIAPSVSPIYDNNPAFLLLRVTADGGLGDYVLYAYDAHTTKWSPEFDFDDVYGVQRFDAPSLARAHAVIGADPATRRRWGNALVAGAPRGEVNGSDWRTAWCAQTLEGRRYSACAHLRRRLLVLPIIVGLLFIIMVASVVLIVLRMTGWRRP